MPGSKTWKPATVVEHTNKPRSYLVRAGNQSYRRNRKHLRTTTEKANENTDCDDEWDGYGEPTESTSANTPPELSPGVTVWEKTVPNTTRSRSGRLIKAPIKLDL